MRITIKHLQEKLEYTQQSEKRYRELYQALKEKEDRSIYETRISDNATINCLQSENRRLMGIIRILAKDPTLEIEAHAEVDKDLRNSTK